MEKLDKLNDKWETVTLQLEKLEIKRENLIDLNKDTFFVDEKIFDLEVKQYDIGLLIEELE